MKRFNKLCFWIVFIIYLEMIFKIALFDNAFNINLVYLLLFIIPIALLFHLFTSLFNSKINKILSYIFIIFITLVFIAQLVYYKIYLSVFSIYSMGKGGQVFEFADTIFKIILQNILPICLMLIPLIIYIIFNRKYIDYSNDKLKYSLFILLAIIIFQVGANLLLYTSGNKDYSAKELYYDTHSPTLSASKLGLLTTMRVDLKRLISGFEEKSKLDIKPVNNEEKENKKIEYNTISIDFDSLISNETNKTIKDMHTYFKNAKATSKNKYTGMFKGKNLIIFLAESFYPIAIDKNLTPTLYKLSTEGFNFTNFYTPVFPVSTTDGEYVTVTSLIPKEGVWSAYRSSNNYFPFVLGNAFKSLNYKTSAYHDNTATYYYRNLYIPNWGYDFKACKAGLNINCKRWPESDLEMIDATYNNYINSEPFLTYYITVSGHLRYTKMGNSIANKNWSYVKDLNYSEGIKAYMACNIELDKALSNLINYLQAAGTLDDTVIAISGDHYPYGLTLDEINSKSTYIRDDNFEKHHSSFILWNSKMKPVTIDKLGSSLDILPTILNLFGVSYDSRLLMGSDIFSDTEPLIIFSNRSFITNKGRYDSITGKFISNDGLKISDDYISKINKEIYDKFYLSRMILENDYYRKILGKGI